MVIDVRVVRLNVRYAASKAKYAGNGWFLSTQRLVRLKLASRSAAIHSRVLLIGCGLRRGELLSLESIRFSPARSAVFFTDLLGKAGHCRASITFPGGSSNCRRSGHIRTSDPGMSKNWC